MIELLGGKTAANLDDCLVAAWRVTYAKSWHRGAQCNRRGSYLFPACDETILWKRKKMRLQKWPTCIIKSSQQSQQSRTNGYSTSIRSSSYNIKLYRLYIYIIYRIPIHVATRHSSSDFSGDAGDPKLERMLTIQGRTCDHLWHKISPHHNNPKSGWKLKYGLRNFWVK